MRERVRWCAYAAAVLVLVLGRVLTASAQTPPPAPTLATPANGASLVQPITLSWNPVVDADGPIGSYTWQVSGSTAFTTVILSGFTNNPGDPTLSAATRDRISGLPNGTYFWRVKATQLVGGPNFSIDSAWSAVRSFAVTGLGAAPAAPVISAPATGSRFHVRENYDIRWNAVPNAQYYQVEVDEQSNFAYPLTLTTESLTFGTRFQAGWGNAIPNIYYRVRAVSADNVRSLPSNTVNVQVTNAAPVPSAPSLVAPAANATVTVPFTFDWTDTANPQVIGYDLDVDTDPNFSGSFGVLLLQGLARSDYMVASDLPPGNYFWRVRALHGDVPGPWTAGRPIRVLAGPAPSDPGLFAIIAEPATTYGGNPTQARVLLDAPAPAGGRTISVASDLPQAQMPSPTVFIPAGRTDAMVSPIATGPVPPLGVVGTIRAAYGGNEWEMSSLGVLHLLYGAAFSDQSVVGGTTVTGVVTLQSAAPAGGATVRLVSSDTSLARLPPTVFIPAGSMDATFTLTTSAVTEPTRIVVESGMDIDAYRAPQAAITLMPAGSPAPAPSLASIALNPQTIVAGATSTGTVRLTSPAPAGGAIVKLNGSMEGQVITPQNVTIPAGSLSADFAITAPQVNATHWVLIQASYGFSGGAQARLIQIDPGPPGTPTLLAMNATDTGVIGGNPVRGTVALVTPAPAAGGVVNLSTDNPGAVALPATVAIAPGNSTNSFSIGTRPVTVTQFARVDAEAGGVTKSWFLSVAPNPNAPPLLQSVSLNPTSVAGGTSSTGTVFLSSAAPANGVSVTLSTSNLNVARPPPIVLVPAGATSATFGVTTFAVSSTTSATITAMSDVSRSATLTVTAGTGGGGGGGGSLGAPTLQSPASDARFSPGQNIAFDWSDVGGAASYTLQIDDADSFPAPQIVSTNVTASAYGTSTLPARKMWWRVRANDASGNPGAWSSVRRFEVKN